MLHKSKELRCLMKCSLHRRVYFDGCHSSRSSGTVKLQTENSTHPQTPSLWIFSVGQDSVSSSVGASDCTTTVRHYGKQSNKPHADVTSCENYEFPDEITPTDLGNVLRLDNLHSPCVTTASLVPQLWYKHISIPQIYVPKDKWVEKKILKRRLPLP